MRIKTSLLGLALGLACGAAAAQPVGENPPTTAVICLDVSGRSLPATCRASASRIDQSYDICLCPGDTQRVMASVCPAGVHPPPESAAFEKARLRAIQHGSVVGASFEGRPMCVSPRQSPYRG